MFIGFFYYLRARGLKISTTEWLALMQALAKGLEHQSLMGFYQVCRCLCVKRESEFDLYDQAFAEFFKDVTVPEDAFKQMMEEVADWIRDAIEAPQLTPEQIAMLEALDLDELRRLFEERLKEQNERHEGGNRWIGTGGTSPFGQGGVFPGGLRVGGSGGGRSAMQVAAQRRFQNLRSDRVLDVRQIGLALRQLRQLARDGRPDQLDLDETIDTTAKNAGDIELVFRPERKNTVKLLLLMDVGGSMTPYTRLSERLFSAAHKATHFKQFKHYYFHNCIYSTLYENMARGHAVPTGKVLNDLDRTWFCVIVGDAAMHPYELQMAGGAINWFEDNADRGITWLQRVADRFPRTIWLNPEPERFWGIESTQIIRTVFDMYELTIDGLRDGISKLRTTHI